MRMYSEIFIVSFLFLFAANAGDESIVPLKPEPGKEFQMISATPQGEQRRIERQKHFLERQAKDRKMFDSFTLREIEDLYQTQNTDKNSAQSRLNLEKIISDPRFENANRVGCALLYLATMENPEKVEERLKLAIEKYSDSWYGSGVNVGAYARFKLGMYYWRNGEKEKASKLFNEIRTDYPDATGHAGEILTEKIPD